MGCLEAMLVMSAKLTVHVCCSDCVFGCMFYGLKEVAQAVIYRLLWLHTCVYVVALSSRLYTQECMQVCSLHGSYNFDHTVTTMFH